MVRLLQLLSETQVILSLLHMAQVASILVFQGGLKANMQITFKVYYATAMNAMPGSIAVACSSVANPRSRFWNQQTAAEWQIPPGSNVARA